MATMFTPFDQWNVLFYKTKPHYALSIDHGANIRTLMAPEELKKVKLELAPSLNGVVEMCFLFPVDGDTVVKRLRAKLNRQANAKKRKRAAPAKPPAETDAKKARLAAAKE